MPNMRLKVRERWAESAKPASCAASVHGPPRIEHSIRDIQARSHSHRSVSPGNAAPVSRTNRCLNRPGDNAADAATSGSVMAPADAGADEVGLLAARGSRSVTDKGRIGKRRDGSSAGGDHVRVRGARPPGAEQHPQQGGAIDFGQGRDVSAAKRRARARPSADSGSTNNWATSSRSSISNWCGRPECTKAPVNPAQSPFSSVRNLQTPANGR